MWGNVIVQIKDVKISIILYIRYCFNVKGSAIANLLTSRLAHQAKPGPCNTVFRGINAKFNINY